MFKRIAHSITIVYEVIATNVNATEGVVSNSFCFVNSFTFASLMSTL